MQKTKHEQNRSRTKQSYLCVGVGLSILLNVLVIIVVLIVCFDVHTGRMNYLTGGTLQVDTCSNYFDKTAIESGAPKQIGNVKFVPTYFTSAEQKNYCNALNNNIEFQHLIQSDNQRALDYYDKTTEFSYSTTQAQYQIVVPYDATTHKPISPESMGLVL